MDAAVEILARPSLLIALVTALALQGALVVSATALATQLLAGSTGATRSTVWNWAMAALLLLPIAPIVLTRWHLPVFIADAPPYSAAWLEIPREPHLGAGIVLMMLVGVVLKLGRFAHDAAMVAAITRRGVEEPAAPATRLALTFAADARLRGGVRVVYSDEVRVPATWRLRRPVILLPACARDWSADRARPVVRHELAHIRRRDYGTHLAAEIACAIHWMNPLVRWAADRLRREQELACDEDVLRAGTRPHDYAGVLLGFARDSHRAPIRRGALLMASPASLKGRVRSILDFDASSASPPGRASLAVGCALLAFALATTSVSLWACDPARPPADTVASGTHGSARIANP